jgi:hypothetical protein
MEFDCMEYKQGHVSSLKGDFDLQMDFALFCNFRLQVFSSSVFILGLGVYTGKIVETVSFDLSRTGVPVNKTRFSGSSDQVCFDAPSKTMCTKNTYRPVSSTKKVGKREGGRKGDERGGGVKAKSGVRETAPSLSSQPQNNRACGELKFSPGV